MDPKITSVAEQKLIGKRLQMTFVRNATPELWHGFMRERESIDAISADLFSVAIYPVDFFARFNPATTFEKWAAAPTDNFDNVPPGMETLVIPAGEYAVFHYVGSSADAPQIFSYIFNEWLPESGYAVDDRPHFEILGRHYRNNDPASEEDIYIPIRQVNE